MSGPFVEAGTRSEALGLSLKYGEHWPRELGSLCDVGFRGMELAADSLGVIAAGQLDTGRLASLVARLAEYPYWFTMHAPGALDLRDTEERAWQRDLLHATIRLAGTIGASRLVVHYEAESGVPATERQMMELLLEAAVLAQEEGVVLCIENIEIERVEPVIECVRALDHPNVKMTLDVGHAWLAAGHFGFDFFDALRLALPYAGHLHVSDNFGRFETMRLIDYDRYRAIPYKKLLMLGKGDLHLPVGFGSIPYHEVFRSIQGYDGTVVMECRFGQYPGEIGEIYARLRERVALLDAAIDELKPQDAGAP